MRRHRGCRAEVTVVIESFRHPGRSFLMPPADVALGADSLIDISHESLIRGWQRLKDWVEGEALSAGIYRRVAETAVLHKGGKAGLWRDPDLQIALGWREQTRPNRAWAQRYHPEFDTAMGFLDESQAVRDTEALETERVRKKNLRRAWMFTGILGLAFIASFQLYLDANRQQKIAQEQKVRAEGKQREAERAEQVANQEKARAEQLTGHIRQQALRLRKLNLNDHSTIVNLADKLIAYSPPQEIALWRNIKAYSLSQMEDHERAAVELTAVLKNNPAHIAARLRRSYQYLNLGEEKRSLADLEIYFQSDPYSYIAHLNMGHNLGVLGRYEEAAAVISKAIDSIEHKGDDVTQSELSPEIKRATGYRTLSVDRYSVRNAFYYELVNLQAYSGGKDFHGTLIEADKHFTSLAELLFATNWAYLHLRRRPGDYGAFASQGAMWERAGFKDQALHSYARFQQEHGRRGDTRYDDLAKFVGQRMTELHPSGALLAEIDPKLEKAEALDLAVEVLELLGRSNIGERSEEQDTSSTRVKDREFKMRDLHERLTRAIEGQSENITSEAGRRSEVEKIELLIHRAHLRYEMKDYAGAREDCDAILQLASNTSSVYLIRALANVGAEMPASVVTADLQKAVELDPVNPLALLQLSRRIESSKPDEVRTLLERSSAASDLFTLPWIYYDLAQLEHKNGNYEKALQALEVAIRVKSDVLEFYNQRAEAEERLGRSENEVRRNRSAGYNSAGDLRLKLDQPKAALDIYMRSLDLLVDLEKKNSSAELQRDLAVTVSKISEVIISLGAKDKAIVFWETVIQSGHLRRQEGILKGEIQRLADSP